MLRTDNRLQGVARLFAVVGIVLFLSCLRLSAPAFAAAVNDSIDAATPIAINSVTSGVLDKSSDEQWFAITLPSDGKLDILFGGEYAKSGSWMIYLKNSANEEIWSDRYSLSNTEDSVICTVGLPAGKFFIRVDNNSGSAGYRFHFTPQFSATDAWEKEQNDSIVTSNPMPLNTVANGNLQVSDDEDWYSVTLPAAGKFEIVFGGEYAKSGSWMIYLKNSANGEIWSDRYSLSNTEDSVICTTGLPAGTYSIRVDNNSGSAGFNYHFIPRFTESDSWEQEFNDTIVTANPIALKSTVNGNLQVSSDEDWYRIAVPQGGILQITFGGEFASSGSWDVSLYNSSNSQLWSKACYANSTKDVVAGERNVTPDTYYVRVDNRSGTASLDYHLVARVVVSLESATVSGIESYTYTGSGITPEPVVKLDSETLRKGIDYTLAYTNNINAGTATVVVAGREDYSGGKTVNFTITPANISDATIGRIDEKRFSGKAIEPAPSIMFNGALLARGADYTLGYANNIEAGTGYVTIYGSKNFTGTTTKSFNISKAQIASTQISGLSARSYTGKAINPSLVVKLDGYTLSAGKDYTVSVTNNTNVGNANVVITGKGSMTGALPTSFTIKKATNKITAKNVTKRYSTRGSGSLAKKSSFSLSAKAKWNQKKVKFGKANLAGGKHITVSKSGKVVLKKGLPSGTYKLKVKVVSPKGNNYNSATKTIVATIKVS